MAQDKGSGKVENAFNANHFYRDLLASSVFFQLLLFVIVTGVLRNYLQRSKGNLLLEPLKMYEEKIR